MSVSALTLLPEFSKRTTHINGFYGGPDVTPDNIENLFAYYDETTEVDILSRNPDGSISISVGFPGKPGAAPTKKNPRNLFQIEGAFIAYPDDWDGFDHHMVQSTQKGCVHECGMCGDGLPVTFRGNVAGLQQLYITRRTMREANAWRTELGLPPIAENARIKILHTGSGDPFANADHVATFLKHVHLAEPKVKGVYTSTAGAISKLPVIVEAVKIAKENGVIVTSQFSTHNLNPEERADLMRRPRTTALQQIRTAVQYTKDTGNTAYINYMVVPGWNDQDTDTDLIATELKDTNCVLKLVALNSVEQLHGIIDDAGNMFVLHINPELEGQIDEESGKPIKQILIKPYLQVKCLDEQVNDFRTRIEQRAPKDTRGFGIITPEDRANIVGANCGMVGISTMNHAADSAPAETRELRV